MDTIRVLLIDTNGEIKNLIEDQFKDSSVNLSVTLMNPKKTREGFKPKCDQFDVILFGEKLSPSVIIQSSQEIRSINTTIPLLVLTRESEAKVSRNFQEVGIDDVLNIVDLSTPLFSWTFMSTLKQAEVRKKANEFDIIRDRLQHVNEALTCITHEMNNPLGMIRLAVYNLENPELPDQKKVKIFKLLAESVNRVHAQMKELHTIRYQINKDTTILKKVLAGKEHRAHAMI